VKRDQPTAFTIWFTGLSGAGKTTLSKAVLQDPETKGLRVCLLNAGDLRRKLFPDLRFSRSDREENVRRIGYLAGLLTANGVNTLVASMSPERAARDTVRQKLTHFLEVFVDSPIEICQQRDPVGLYRRFRQGEVSHISGLDDPYEAPLNPDVHCRTDLLSVEACTAQIVAAIMERLGP